VSDLVERCRKPGCGARKAAPCKDWDCPQVFVLYAEHDAALSRLRAENERLTAHISAREDARIECEDAYEVHLTAERGRAEAAEKRIAELEGERDLLTAKSLEGQMLAHGWMRAHDGLLGWVQSDPEMMRKMLGNGPSYNLPRVADLPDAIARAEAAERRADTATLGLSALRAALQSVDRLSLVIESAVRNADPTNHAAVLAAIKATRAALSQDQTGETG
jgi:hypothetical protein